MFVDNFRQAWYKLEVSWVRNRDEQTWPVSGCGLHLIKGIKRLSGVLRLPLIKFRLIAGLLLYRTALPHTGLTFVSGVIWDMESRLFVNVR